MIVTKNLLGGRPSPAIRCDSKHITLESSTVGNSTSGIEDIRWLGSQPKSWYLPVHHLDSSGGVVVNLLVGGEEVANVSLGHGVQSKWGAASS
jgi:hypothetical protein